MHLNHAYQRLKMFSMFLFDGFKHSSYVLVDKIKTLIWKTALIQIFESHENHSSLRWFDRSKLIFQIVFHPDRPTSKGEQ